MFHFTHPDWLWLAALIPPVLWVWTLHRRSILRHPSIDLFPTEARRTINPADWGSVILRGLALLALVGAIAGPRWRDEKTLVENEGIAIGMVVDVSESMGNKDFPFQKKKITRLDAVKKAVTLFVRGGDAPGGIHLKGRPTDEIGLTVFATFPDTACPLTYQHKTLLNILNTQEPILLTGESGTNIVNAVVWGLTQVDRAQHRSKVLVLLTDGENTVEAPDEDGQVLKLDALIASAKSLNIRIYAIDAAGTELAGITPMEKQESAKKRAQIVETLQNLSRQTNGRYFRVDSTESLLSTYQEIDRITRTLTPSPLVRRYHEGYPWFALGSLVLYQLVIILEITLWRRVP